jgi:hypothetical protein
MVGAEFPPIGTKFNHDYFIDTVLPNLYNEKRRIAGRKSLPNFSIHMNNSIYHDSAKITEKLKKRHIAQTPHLPYSPNLSVYDFSLLQI